MTVEMSVSERRIRNNRIRRQRELRRRIFMSVLTCVMAVAFSLIFFSFKTKAQGSDEEILYKYYKSTVVEEGDTLWDYAASYASREHYTSYSAYIDEVKKINVLPDETITAGQHIILPYYSPEFL